MRHLVVGTAGHIDHGKSALVLALTGMDPDRLQEEKARGITIDLGFAHWHAPGLSVGFVDVPGHERFIKNMLAGVGGLDAVILVVAADESVMPQTREHFEICRLLHVPSGIIALTKSDLVEADTLDLVRLEVHDLVAGSFLAGAPIIPVSARTGAGLDDLRAAIVALGERRQARAADGAARLPIDRVFTVRGFGTVVTGTLVSGELGIDDEVVALPGGLEGKVRGLQSHGAAQPTATAGQRVAVNLGGIDAASLVRGQSLVTPGAFDQTRVFDARIELVATARPLRHGTRVRVHQGTSEGIGRVAISMRAGSAGATGVAVGAEIPPGQQAYVRVRMESPMVITRGDRFVLRAYSPLATLAGGVVLDPQPPRGGIRTAAGRQRFLNLDPDGPESGDGPDARAVRALVADSGPAGLPLRALTARLGLRPDARRDVLAHLQGTGGVTAIGDVLVSPPLLEQLAGEVLQLLRGHHEAHPLSEGMPREEVRERLFAHAAPGVFEHVLEDLIRRPAIVARDRLALVTHRVEVDRADADALARIVEHYRAAGLKPPDAQEAAAALGIEKSVVDRMMTLAVRQRVLVRVDVLTFHESALAGLVREVRALRTASGEVPVMLDVAGFKQRYGITRKFAIPLLEYLDRERVTRRVGDRRLVI